MNVDHRIKKNINNTEISENDNSASSNSSNSFNSLRKVKKFKPRQRQENSLGELTKNVIKYIKKHGQKEICISTIVNDLKVKKRRIYDITNVLEGIGCIKKLEKNKIKWMDDSLYKDHEAILNLEVNNIKKEINSLITEEKFLDKCIQDLKSSYESIQDNANFKQNGYLTYNDVRLLTQGEDLNLIAIRAPAGTSIDIPDPENVHKVFTQTNDNMRKGIEKYDKDLLDSLEKKYQLFLESPNGEINVYLVLSSENEEIKYVLNEEKKF